MIVEDDWNNHFWLSFSFRLHVLWAAPQYLTVMWQLPRIESPSSSGVYVVGLTVFIGHTHGSWVGRHCLDLTLLFLKRSYNVFFSVGTSVYYRYVITADHHVAVAACYVLLHRLGVAFVGVKLRNLMLSASKSA